MAKKTALLGMLVALAFVLSYIETLVPVNLGIPGAKLGLANLVVMVALYTLGTKEAFALSMVRILLTGLTFSSMAAMLYSFAGGLLSFAVMYLAKRSKLFSATGVSVLGGISHNAGQILVAMWDLINEDNTGCISCVEADGETVFDIPENLKSEGMYEAE